VPGFEEGAEQFAVASSGLFPADGERPNLLEYHGEWCLGHGLPVGSKVRWLILIVAGRPET
jgi:hypothetical protein